MYKNQYFLEMLKKLFALQKIFLVLVNQLLIVMCQFCSLVFNGFKSALSKLVLCQGIFSLVRV